MAILIICIFLTCCYIRRKRKQNQIGITNELSPINKKIKTPKPKSSTGTDIEEKVMDNDSTVQIETEEALTKRELMTNRSGKSTSRSYKKNSYPKI